MAQRLAVVLVTLAMIGSIAGTCFWSYFGPPSVPDLDDRRVQDAYIGRLELWSMSADHDTYKMFVEGLIKTSELFREHRYRTYERMGRWLRLRNWLHQTYGLQLQEVLPWFSEAEQARVNAYLARGHHQILARMGPKRVATALARAFGHQSPKNRHSLDMLCWVTEVSIYFLDSSFRDRSPQAGFWEPHVAIDPGFGREVVAELCKLHPDREGVIRWQIDWLGIYSDVRQLMQRFYELRKVLHPKIGLRPFFVFLGFP